MEITPFTIYLISLLDNLIILYGVTLFVLGLAAFFAVIHWFIEGGNSFVKPILISIVIIALLAAITPSSKTVVAMYLIPKIANIEGLDRIPANIIGFINKYLEDYTKEVDY